MQTPLIFYIFFVTSHFLGSVHAYKERGAAERVLFYYAYLAEEIYAPKGYTIGVDCAATMGGLREIGDKVPRCNFNQFLEFIWAPAKEGQRRPRIRNILQAGEIFEQVPIATLAERIFKYRDPSQKGLKLTDNVDSDRLVTGLTDTDKNKWFDAVPKVGNAIGEVLNSPEELSQAQSRIVQLGQAASDFTVDLRFSDMESYREVYVQKELGNEIELQYKLGRVSQRSVLLPSWDMIDQRATIEMYEKEHPDIEQRLTDAIKKWEESGQRALEHLDAMKAINKADVGCRCGAV